MKVATFNVLRLTKPDKLAEFIVENRIDIIGLQETGGKKSMIEVVSNIKNGKFECVFDSFYKTYGNGLIYNSLKFELIDSKTIMLGNSIR